MEQLILYYQGTTRQQEILYPKAIPILKLPVRRNIKITWPYFLLWIILTALFQRYVPVSVVSNLLWSSRWFWVLMWAALWVPLYVCLWWTIPLIVGWLQSWMSLWAASAFMITWPWTKFTSLWALKIILNKWNFLIYILFIMLYSLLLWLLINIL